MEHTKNTELEDIMCLFCGSLQGIHIYISVDFVIIDDISLNKTAVGTLYAALAISEMSSVGNVDLEQRSCFQQSL